MKKLLLLIAAKVALGNSFKRLAFLVIAMMLSSTASALTNYCGTTRNSVSPNTTYTLNYTCKNVSGTTYQMILDFTNTVGSISNANVGANPGPVTVSASPVWTNSNKTLTYTFTAGSTPTLYVATIFVIISGTEVRWDLPMDANFAATCGGATAPALTTTAATAVGSTTGTMNGNISSNGGAAITSYGFYWSTTNGFADGAGTQVVIATSDFTGNISSNLTGLTVSIAYYYKAYATNSSGTTYGTQQTFTTTSAPPSYTWNGATTDWAVSTNWTPTRTTPAANDILIFPSGTFLVTNPGTTAGQTIGRLQIDSGADVTFQITTNNARTLTMTGNAGDELSIASGGSLKNTVTGTNAGLTYAFGASSTATVAGRFEMTNTCGCGQPITLNTTNCVMTVTGTLAAGGTLSNNPWTGVTTTSLIVNGTYEHKYTTTGGTFPTPTWGASSTAAVIGNTSNTGGITSFNQNFRNLTWNCPGQTGNIVLGNFIFSSVLGTFTVVNTGSGTLFLGDTNPATYTIANFSQTGGTVQMNTTGSITMNVSGNFSQSGGTFTMNTTGSPTLNVVGTFNQTGGILQSGTSGTPTISFNGSGAPQNVNFFNASPAGATNYRINNTFGINLTGSGTLTTNFNINATGGLKISQTGAAPITSSLALVYAPGAVLTYDGGANRTATSTVFPASNGPSELAIAGGTTVNLNSLNRTVSVLKLNGATQAFSNYGGTGSGATTTSAFFTANPGIVTVFCVTNTVALTSSIGTDAQTLAGGSPITTITYATTGATGATVTGLPTGVTGVWSGNVVTISGTPTSAGGTYTVTTTGGCGVASTTGTISITASSYTWNGATSDWTVGTNWTPTRTAAFNDLLTFPAGTTIVTNVPTQIIGRLVISAGAVVDLRTVTSGKTLTITSDGTSADELSVGSGATLRLNSTGTALTLAFSGTSATANIAGTLEIINTNIANSINLANCVMTVASTGLFATGGTATYNPFTNVTSSTLKIDGTYQHKWTGGLCDIPGATWNTGSTFLMTGSVGNVPFGGTNLGSNFYNVTWNTPGLASAVYLGNMNFGNGTISNNFSVISTGTGSIVLNNGGAPLSKTIKNYLQSGGTVNFAGVGSSFTFNVSGDFSQTAGLIQATSGSGTINFNGTTLQTYTSGGTLANTINHTIAANAIVDFGTSVISSGSNGAFTLNTGGKIITANANGLTSSGASGTVQSTGTRTYNSGAKYEFKGANTGNFTLSTANTITGTGSLTFSNAGGSVTLGQSLTTPTLDLTNNVVTTGAFTLTLSGAASTVSRTTGWVNGNFNKTITGNSTKTFEIGDATLYTPVTLDFTGNITAGNITAKSTIGDHPQIATSVYNVNRTVNRFYTLTASGVLGLTSYSPTFNYIATDNDPTAVPANYVIRQYNGTWSAPSISGTPTNTSAGTTGLTTFGDFAIGETKIIPTATIAGTTTVCINEPNPVVTFTAANGADTVQFRFYYKLNGGSEIYIDTNPGQFTATIQVATNTARTDVYTLTRVEDLNTGIDQVQTGSATVAVNLCTKLRSIHCGITVPNLDFMIQCAPVAQATGYRFEVTEGVNPPRTVTVSGRNYFYLNRELLGGVTFGKTYSIKVAIKLPDNSFTVYGSACIVKTPNPPVAATSTKLRSIHCGITVPYLNYMIQCETISTATKYTFEVTDGVNPARTVTVSGRNHFSLSSELLGGVTYNKTYSIKVDAYVNGSWIGYGSACNVSTPAGPAPRMASQDINTNMFEVKAFPNPFARHFSLDIQSSSDDLVQVQVYDMIGRALEVQKATVSELSMKEIGTNYPSGVYNVVVSQGDKVRSVRMVKR